MIRIEIEERVGAAIVRGVAEGSADLGILGSHTPSQGLAALPYHSDNLVLAVPAAHPLARRKQVRFADALAYPFVAHHPSSSLWALMTRASYRLLLATAVAPNPCRHYRPLVVRVFG